MNSLYKKHEDALRPYLEEHAKNLSDHNFLTLLQNNSRYSGYVVDSLCPAERVERAYRSVKDGTLSVEEVSNSIFADIVSSQHRFQYFRNLALELLRSTEEERLAARQKGLKHFPRYFSDDEFLDLYDAAITPKNFQGIIYSLSSNSLDLSYSLLFKLLDRYPQNMEISNYAVIKSLEINSSEIDNILSEENRNRLTSIARSYVFERRQRVDRTEEESAAIRLQVLDRIDNDVEDYLNVLSEDIPKVITERRRYKSIGFFDIALKRIAKSTHHTSRARCLQTIVEHIEKEIGTNLEPLLSYRPIKYFSHFSKLVSEENRKLLLSVLLYASTNQVLRAVANQLLEYGDDAIREAIDSNPDLSIYIFKDDLGHQSLKPEEVKNNSDMRQFIVKRLLDEIVDSTSTIRPTNWGIHRSEEVISELVKWLRKQLYAEIEIEIPERTFQFGMFRIQFKESAEEAFAQTMAVKFHHELVQMKKEVKLGQVSTVEEVKVFLNDRDPTFFKSIDDSRLDNIIRGFESRGFWGTDGRSVYKWFRDLGKEQKLLLEYQE